jgi:hypothetical protein
LLSAALFVLLGEISYCIYLFHQIFIRFYLHEARHFTFLPGWLIGIVFWILLLVFSFVVWRFVEKPSRAFLVGRFHAPGPSPISSDPDRKTSFFSRMSAHFHSEAISTALSRCSRILLIGGFLVVLVGFAILMIHVRPNPTAPSLPTALQIDERAAEGIRNVNFGNRFILTGLEITPEKDSLVLALHWKSCLTQPLAYCIALHFLDEKAKIVDQQDYPQDAGQKMVSEGLTWSDLVRIPYCRLKDSEKIGIGVYSPPPSVMMLKADQGPRDMEGHRLLLRVKKGGALRQ